MVISNEPGLYLTGQFGIRHENLVLVRKGEKTNYGQFMYLEPLTMVPFDKDAIDYHTKVYETLAPHFTGEGLVWLGEATAAV